jgi:hypothetical protein
MAQTKNGTFKKLVCAVAAALTAAAVVKELRTPAEERTWNGTVASVVPYDFRVPTLERAKERLWNPDAESYVGPRVFGVGWTVNVGKVVHLIQAKVQAKAQAQD